MVHSQWEEEEEENAPLSRVMPRTRSRPLAPSRASLSDDVVPLCGLDLHPFSLTRIPLRTLRAHVETPHQQCSEVCVNNANLRGGRSM